VSRGKYIRRSKDGSPPPEVRPWSGRAVQEIRARMELSLPQPCGVCRRPVRRDQPWQVGHIISRAERPDLTWVPSNWRVEHQGCGSGGGQAAVIAKAKREARAERVVGQQSLELSLGGPSPGNRRTSQETHTSVRVDLNWTFFTKHCPEWLDDILVIPDNASPPLAVTQVHPKAVGTYGPEACEWIERELKRELPRGLRWWQRYAIYRQLEHDQEGLLVWKTVLESTPRRCGKSVRLRAMALFRISHPEMFGNEPQIVLHTGRDVAVVREIHRKAWRWATERGPDGWKVSKGVGQEEVINDEVHRWLVRSTGSVYGYDICMGMVDEAWDVDPEVFTDGLEPSTLERISPQSILTSTSHRRATSLMRTKISGALAADDGKTLLLLWGAPGGSDESDLQVWRSASPHWSSDREEMLQDKWAAAVRGEVDLEFDDQDPMASFRSQYLNVWLLRDIERPPPGTPVVTEDDWELIELPAVPPGAPNTVAVEGWYSDGVSVLAAWNRGGMIVVTSTSHPTAADAAAAAASYASKSPVQVGKSLLAVEPALSALWHEPAQGTTQAAVKELGRLISEGALRHAGADELTDQVMALRVQPSSDGPRLVSKHRADAVKALVWAVASAKEVQEVPAVF